MNNKPSTKKATIITVIFCILLVLGIVLNLVIGPCKRSDKVRNVAITFTGVVSTNLQSALETALTGSVVINEVGKVVTTATTTTTKATTTTTKATTTTTADTTASTTAGAAAAAETTQATTTATTVAGDTTAGTTGTGSTTGATTTTTKATTTTAAANGYKSGKLLATVSNCDEKTDEDIKRIFAEIFAGKDYKDNNLVITDIYEVESVNGFGWTQIYACVILLIVVFVYCLIRFYSIGAVASAASVVIPAVVAVIGSVGISLIFRIFADISISAVVAVATVGTVIFGNIILENVKSGSDKDSCTVISITAVIASLLVLVAIVSLIAWNGEVMFSCFQYAAAVICSAIAALAYVRCIMSKLAPKAFEKKKSSKKPVIK